MSIKEVEINKEPVELYKLLKFESMASSGGEAKFFISEGQVLVNDEVETRKRKKLMAGDVVEFQGEKVLLKLKEGA
jgi:ribosome-associated protein